VTRSSKLAKNSASVSDSQSLKLSCWRGRTRLHADETGGVASGGGGHGGGVVSAAVVHMTGKRARGGTRRFILCAQERAAKKISTCDILARVLE
jgi:hypothetical protein